MSERNYSPEELYTLKLFLAGYDYDPGSSDLDDEQPIHVRMAYGENRTPIDIETTLGAYRRIQRIVAREECAV